MLVSPETGTSGTSSGFTLQFVLGEDGLLTLFNRNSLVNMAKQTMDY